MKPVHPILVHFPIALTVFAVAAEAGGFFTGLRSLSEAGGWAMVAAGVAAVATGAAGYLDMRRLHRIDGIAHAAHGRVHRHMYVGIALVLVLVGLATWRATLLLHGTPVPMLYIDAGVVAVALTALQGWLGGELVFGDGVFVKVPATTPASAKASMDVPPPSAIPAGSGTSTDAVDAASGPATSTSSQHASH